MYCQLQSDEEMKLLDQKNIKNIIHDMEATKQLPLHTHHPTNQQTQQSTKLTPDSRHPIFLLQQQKLHQEQQIENPETETQR